jgi:replicative DNA helicase
MKEELEKLYGTIAILDRNEGLKVYNRIKASWNETQLEKRIYEVIGHILKKTDKTPDILNITHEFKNQNWLDKETVVKISQMTRHNYSNATNLSVNTNLQILKSDEVYKQAVQVQHQLTNILDPHEFTPEKFNKIVQEAKEITITDDKPVKNSFLTFQIIDDHYKAQKGQINGIDLGYFSLRKIILLEPVDLMVVGARPAMGKTAWAVATALRMAHENKHVVFFALEMTREQVLRRILSNLARINSNKIKYGECTQEEIDRIYQAQNQPELDRITIIEGSQTPESIASKLYEIHKETKVDVFIVDYLQKIQSRKDRSRYEAVTDISNQIKTLCQNIKIPCIALAQLSRDSSKTGKRPTLPDLKESGEIEQDASVVAFLHRPEYYGEETTYNGQPAENMCEFLIGKNREGELGIFEYKVELDKSRFS